MQQILAFSRQGRQEKKPLNIGPIVKEGLKLLRASLPATIEIRQEMGKDLGTVEAESDADSSGVDEAVHECGACDGGEGWGVGGLFGECGGREGGRSCFGGG